MKALLIHLGAVPPKTHDLVVLDQLLAAKCTDWSWPTAELRFVSRAAVAYRYPGESADQQDAATSLRLSEQMRDRLLELIREEP